MFELSVACKYLLPRRRQLSVSIISLISILVIALVVWLIVVFFSVTDGLEKGWINKLTALTAPIRITPTEAYYNSYYYQIDAVSHDSGYSHKTIREKNETAQADPYDPEIDEEIPTQWPPADLNDKGQVKDLVKLAFASINDIKGVSKLKSQDFEMTFSHLNLHLIRPQVSSPTVLHTTSSESSLSYPIYLGNFETESTSWDSLLLPQRLSDMNNFFSLIGLLQDTQASESGNKNFSLQTLRLRLKDFFKTVSITHLKTPPAGWPIPKTLWPNEAIWSICALIKNNKVLRLYIPTNVSELSALKESLENQGMKIQMGTLTFHDSHITLKLPGEESSSLLPLTSLVLADTEFEAELIPSSIELAKKVDDVKFAISLNIQGVKLQGPVPYRGLTIGQVQKHENSQPLWVHKGADSYFLPKDPAVGEGILLPKSFRETGILGGDRGYLTYYTPTASILQEQRLPVYVAGFYDPGIIPIGGKFVLANPEVTSVIHGSYQENTKLKTNGINVRFEPIHKASEVKEQLVKSFQEQGIDRYWTIETYKEFEFTKEIIQELHSQKNIFTLISIVIILVACSNIISMLIILVNDKKQEIGILRSMGASSKSIALIFGLSGALIGILGSVIGIAAAILTLNHLPLLISIMSRFQGHDVGALFYGEAVPHQISVEALSFVILATMIISLLAGIVPAVKACLLRPSSTLRSTGG